MQVLQQRALHAAVPSGRWWWRGGVVSTRSQPALRAARDLIWLGLGGTALWLPHSAAAQLHGGALLCSLLAALGLLMLAAWMVVHQPAQPRRMWAGLALALALWQGLGMQWLGSALAPDARSAFGPLLGLMWGLNLAPLIGLGWGLSAAAAAVQRRWAGVRRAGWVGLVWLAWPLAWATWALWREELWWGGNYAGLALGLLDLPGLPLVLPVLGASLWEGACWGLALAAAKLLLGWRARGGATAAVALVGAAAGVLTVVGMPNAPAGSSASPVDTVQVPNRPDETDAAWWTQATGAPVAVVAIQPAAHTPEWNLAARDLALSQLHTALVQAAPGTVLVTTETFLREPPPQHAWGVWQDLMVRLEQSQNHLLLGLPLVLRGRDDDAQRGVTADTPAADEIASLGLMNTVLQISSQGPGQGLRTSVYAKQRLAPAGEALPWPALLRPFAAAWFLQPQQLGRPDMRPDMQPGPPALNQALFVAGHTVALSICHELAFGSHLRRLALHADWLLNVADDSWITDPDYRLQVQRLARLRALELGKPLLRVSQGAASLLVGADGQALAQAPTAGHGLWPFVVQPFVGQTPYGRYGDEMKTGVFILSLGLLAMGVLTAQFSMTFRRRYVRIYSPFRGPFNHRNSSP